MKKVKEISPIMSETLCKKCKFGGDEFCMARRCGSCELFNGKRCVCTTVAAGQPCPYFERAEEAQK